MNQPDIRVAIRGYRDGALLFEDLLDVKWNDDADEILAGVAERHTERLAGSLHMIEIEFLDEPDVNQRFFRIGTDPRGMVAPVRVM